MAKRNKSRSDMIAESANSHQPNPALHLPAKQPTLLAVSIALFALWFVFLLLTALFG